MAAYLLVDVNQVTDGDRLEQYRQAVLPIVERFGGRYLAASDQFDLLEGAERPVIAVIIEFPDMERLHGWYESNDYAPLKALRQQSGTFRFIAVPGLGEF